MADLREPGDFAAVRVSGLVGEAIRWAEAFDGQHGDWEHAVVWLGGGKVLQAEPGGAAIVDRPDIRPGDIWSTGLPEFTLTAAQQAMVPALAQTYKGIGYSDLDYVALTAHRLHVPDAPIWPGSGPRRGHLVTLQQFIKDTHHMICSQLVDDFEHRLGLQLFDDGRWEGDVTPWNIGDLIRQAGGMTA